MEEVPRTLVPENMTKNSKKFKKKLINLKTNKLSNPRGSHVALEAGET